MKLSEMALAKKLGVTLNAVSIWEAGGSPSPTIRARPCLLGVNLEWLATARGPQRGGRVSGLRLLGTVAAGSWSRCLTWKKTSYIAFLWP